MQLTLYRLLSRPLSPVPEMPPGVMVRPTEPSDIGRLAESWHCTYEAAGHSEGLNAAQADMQATFEGEYGRLWLAASLVAEDSKSTLVSVVQMVTNAPWPDVPSGPFIIEAFTRPECRREGLARALLTQSLTLAAEANYEKVGLRVLSENEPAVAMYQALGFVVEGDR